MKIKFKASGQGLKEKGFNMTYLTITVTVLAFAEIITLTLLGKRARKKEVPVRQWHSYEENMKPYNKFVGLPENSVFGER